MELFGVGGTELILIIIIAMVVAGPKRVAQWMYYVGKFVARLQRMWSEMMQVIQQELKESGMDIELPKTPPTRQSINQTARNMLKPYTQELDEAQKDIERNLEAVQREANIKQNVMISNQIKQSTSLANPMSSSSQNGNQPTLDSSSNGNIPPAELPRPFGTWSSMPTKADDRPDEK